MEVEVNTPPQTTKGFLTMKPGRKADENRGTDWGAEEGDPESASKGRPKEREKRGE